ncbi:HDOD domain-containing protein [Aestuariibacter sp. GS-14]|uniref:HDOD domain-containing protein n=1 Tax=Aestuariibacter sp. GS-14 TaxID=2590670 RepID=UPI00112D9B87|nr:HDOD domain-containing protein [Aestuariibacter sp. GS-14]TPV58412.1 HDOD domain-containing protein [Aestuariibacter sp. GS-14]
MVEQLLAPPSIAERFDYWLIAPERANEMIGKRAPGEVSYAESEQSYTRRQLLKVEKTAIRDKLQSAKVKAEYLAQINQQVHTLIKKKFIQAISDTPGILDKQLNWQDNSTDLIDLLTTPSATITKVEAIAAGMPWLYDELLKLVNAPQNRKRDARGMVIVVDTLKTALSFMGIDNVKVVLPALMFRQSVPLITDPFPQVKHKTVEYTLTCARTAKEIAPQFGAKPYHAYLLAMLSQLGRSVVLKLYFKLFEQVHFDFLQHAQKAKLRDLHGALTQLLPDPAQCISLVNQHSDKLSMHLLEQMVFKRIDLSTPLHQFLQEPDEEDILPLAKTLQQSRYYTKFRMLSDAKLFLEDEARVFQAGSAIHSDTFESLQRTALSQLPVVAEL